MSVLTADPATASQPSETGGQGRSVLARRVVTAVTTVLVALVVLLLIWALLLRVFDVSSFVGKTPLDVWNYLFSSEPPKGVRPASLSAQAARSEAFDALWTTLVDAGIGFVAGMTTATVVAILFVLYQPFEFAFMPIALLLRSVPLVAMAPVLLLMFGQGNLGIAVIAAIVVLFPALVNIVLGLRGASAAGAGRDPGQRRFLGDRTAAKVRIPSALPQFFASVRISVPGCHRRRDAGRMAGRIRRHGRCPQRLQGCRQLRRGVDHRGVGRHEFDHSVRGGDHRRGGRPDAMGTQRRQAVTRGSWPADSGPRWICTTVVR